MIDIDELKRLLAAINSPGGSRRLYSAAAQALPELIERLERAEAEREFARAHVRVSEAFVTVLTNKLDIVEQENARLREALRRYGRHTDECDYGRGRDIAPGVPHPDNDGCYPCDCGFDDALKERP